MLHFKPKQIRKGLERVKIKNIVSFRPYPTHNRKFQKNSKTIEKIKKNTIMALFQSEIGRKFMRQRENKNYRSLPFLPDA